MTHLIQRSIPLLALLLLVACSPEPQPIEYGLDACYACRMNIVDARHAAELVTEKGKIYKFDAIECMVPYYNNHSDETPFALVLVSDYAQPGALIDGRTSQFLISEAIPSPMGGNLSALASREEADQLLEDNGGDVYDWSQLREYFNR